MLLAEVTLQALRWLPIAVVAGAAAVAGTYWLYSPQLRLRSRGVRWGLPMLRSMALLALAVALIKPVVLRAKSAGERGAIVVLVDRSGSMSVTDGGRSPAQLIALADGLKMLPASATPLSPTVSPDEVEQLRAQGDRINRAASELDYAKLANRGVEAAQARLDDAIAQLATQAQTLIARLKDKSKSNRMIERLNVLIAANAKDREQWLRRLRVLIDQAAAAAGESENNSAEQLYRGSADARAVCDKLAALSRLELAKVAVRQAFPQSTADDAIAVYGFANSLEPMTISADEHGETVSGDGTNNGDRNGAGGASPNDSRTPGDAGKTGDSHGATGSGGHSDDPNGANGKNHRTNDTRGASGRSDDAHGVGGSSNGKNDSRGVSGAASGASPATQPGTSAAIFSLSATRPVDPATASTDIAGAIRSIVQRYPAGGVRAVVVLSDGRQVGSETSVETLAASVGDVPVYAVRMARTATPRDLTIARITLPARAFVGETLNVRVEVHSTGIRGEVPVTCTLGAATQTKSVVFIDDSTLSVEFSAKLDQAGPLRVGVAVQPAKDEISPANNAAERWVNVLSDKVHVVAIAQSAGRDFQFLRDALARTPWVKLDESIAPSPDSPAHVTSDQLADADLIILEDAGGNLLSADQWQQVRKLVAERGAGAILLAGEAHAADELLIRPDSAELLPFAKKDAASWRNWAGEWPSLRAVPGDAKGLGGSSAGPSRQALPEALRLTDDPESSLKKWQELPAMYRLMNITALKPNATALLVDGENHSAVMTDSRVGAGHVLFVGMTETWRWRYKIGQRDQDRFWLQLVRQVADEPYAATAGGVSIDADRISIEPGKPLRLRARVHDSAGKPSLEPSVQISVKAADGAVRAETLTAVAPGSGRFEKTVNDLPAGEYSLTVDSSAEPKLAIRVAASNEAEMANLAGDDRLLRRITDATSGQAIGLEQLADLPAQIAERASQHPQIAETRLWDSPYLFAFVLACLGLEWAVRKQAGLA